MKGIDCTTAITNTTGMALKAAGYDFAARYLVPDAYRWKRLTGTEAAAITNSGLKILSVFETSANRPSGGAANGTEDGTAAYKEAVAIGQPAGTAIYFACDYNAGASDYDAIEQYLKAAASKITGYSAGLYAGYNVVEEMAKRKACGYFWQTYAWSGGNRSKSANVYQYNNGVILNGISVDLNESYGNEGFWDYSTPAWLDWESIIKKASINPDAWIAAIKKAVAASKSGSDLGKVDIFQYLPLLIEKIYNNR